MTPKQKLVRLLQLLKVFYPSPRKLLRALDEHRSVIGHFFALNVILGTDISCNLRIYCPKERASDLQKVLEKAAYVLTSQHVYTLKEQADSIVFAGNGLHSTKTLQRKSNGAVIEIYISVNSIATYPVFSASATALMNYITGHSIYCAYPSATDSRYLLINALWSAHPEDCPILNKIHEQEVAVLERYGFRRRWSSIQWEFPTHVCYYTPDCPHTDRTDRDKFGRYERLQDSPIARYERPHEVQWVLGGVACSRYCCPLDPRRTIVSNKVPLV